MSVYRTAAYTFSPMTFVVSRPRDPSGLSPCQTPPLQHSNSTGRVKTTETQCSRAMPVQTATPPCQPWWWSTSAKPSQIRRRACTVSATGWRTPCATQAVEMNSARVSWVIRLPECLHATGQVTQSRPCGRPWRRSGKNLAYKFILSKLRSN